MAINIALAGNPNSGKTTMFNDLTGSNQYVGNWPGVTVEKKEGHLKGQPDVIVQDLPGIYSLSPYTLEEVVSRNYLVGEKPDAIIDIVDATNIERNLYLSTQLIELGVPVVMALNMIDLVRKNGDQIDLQRLGKFMGCQVVETSALKHEGSAQVAELATKLVGKPLPAEHPIIFSGPVEHAIAHIEESLQDLVEARFLRWYAIKVFERDHKALEELKLPKELLEHLEEHIVACEELLDDDAESIIIDQRYKFISHVVEKCVKRKRNIIKGSASDQIDRVVTNRVLALPIFAAVMFLVYYVSIGTVGDWTVGFMNDTLFGEWISPTVQAWLEGANVAPWLVGLIVEGIIGGVGAVLGFVLQMLILFLFLSILEDIGYMSRIAFIMDRLFRRFGLSGKSFIPMLVGSGCSVPGIMASRTIGSESDRRMTIMTTSFIPCGAKMPIVGLIAGAFFGESAWVATSAYFAGVAAVIISGVMLKKTKAFAGEPSPFVMELPAYHAPAPANILHTTWERGWSFIKRAGTVILASAIVLWFLQAFGLENGKLLMVADNNSSLLASIGNLIAPIFAPLGFGKWQTAVATFTGLIAKENVVSTFGVLYGLPEVSEIGNEYWSLLAKDFSPLAGYSFMLFNLLCAPCFAAMGAIRREMNSAKWTFGAITYLCVFAYAVCLLIYQLGLLLNGNGFSIATAFALLVLAGMLWLLFRRNKYAVKLEK